MFTIEQYVIAWGIYLLAVMGLLATFWRMTRSVWYYLRQFLRLAAAAFLLVPYPINSTSELLAPAWLMAGLEIVFSGIDGFDRAGKPLLIGAVGALVVYLVLSLIWFLYRRRYPATAKQTETPATPDKHSQSEPDVIPLKESEITDQAQIPEPSQAHAGNDLLAEAESTRSS